jgi:hypothetical protein
MKKEQIGWSLLAPAALEEEKTGVGRLQATAALHEESSGASGIFFMAGCSPGDGHIHNPP